MKFHATTIFAIQHNGACAMSGDGQVTVGNAVVMKKLRKKFEDCLMARCLLALQAQLRMHLHCLNCLKENLHNITVIYNVLPSNLQKNGEEN